MEFKKIINIGVIVSIISFSGVVANQLNGHHKYFTGHQKYYKNNEENTNGLTSGIINGGTDGKNCDSQFLDGVRPVIENVQLKEDTRELCFKGFAIMHSGITHSPLYAVENLTNERVLGAKTIHRQDAFHEEDRLPYNERATLKDYARSGYDRGHMAPSDDMSDMSMQEESFSLANMVMQNPQNNRVLHFGIEKEVRNLAKRNGNVYVVTGSSFTEEKIEKKGKVMIPNYIWKAVYVPRTQQTSAYWEKNDDSLQYEIISMQELRKRTGIDIFPNINQKEKDTVANLPAPKIRRKL